MNSGRRLLITGARGLLGNATVQAAIAAGWQVVTLQRNPSGMADGRSVTDVLGSVDDPGVVERALVGCSAVIHAAARVGIEGQWHQFERANVIGTQVVLERARAAGVGRLVYVSSPSVAHVGRALVGAHADPADPARARGHYSRSKALAEQQVLNTTNMPVVAIRPHLVWGPGDQQLVGRIVDRARSGRLFVIDRGNALIDTTYVDNAAEALVHALERADVEGVCGRPFVVSNGEPRTVRDVVTAIVRAAGIRERVRSVPFAPAWAAGAVGEWVGSALHREPLITRFLVEQLATAHWFDPRPAHEALNWRPRVGFDEGIQHLADHFRG